MLKQQQPQIFTRQRRTQGGGGLGLKSPPWDWYFTKTLL